MLEFIIRIVSLILGLIIVVASTIRVISWLSNLFGWIFAFPTQVYANKQLNGLFNDLINHWFKNPSTDSLYQVLEKHQWLFYTGSRSIERAFSVLSDSARKSEYRGVLIAFLIIVRRIFLAVINFGHSELVKPLFNYSIVKGNIADEWGGYIVQLKQLVRYSPTTAKERIDLLNSILMMLPDGLNSNRADVMLDLGDAFYDMGRHQSKLGLLMPNLWVDANGFWMRHYGAFICMVTSFEANNSKTEQAASLIEAERYYCDALKQYYQLGLFEKASQTLDVLGDCYFDQQRPNDALKTYNKSISLFEGSERLQEYQLYVLYKQALVFSMINDLKTGEEIAWKGLALAELLYTNSCSLSEKQVIAQSIIAFCGYGVGSLSRLMHNSQLAAENQNKYSRHLFKYFDSSKGRVTSLLSGYRDINAPALIRGELIHQEVALLSELNKFDNATIDNFFILPQTDEQKAHRQEIINRLVKIWKQIFSASRQGQAYVNMRQDTGLDVSDLADIFHLLEPKTGILFIQPLTDSIVCFLVCSDPLDFHYHQVDISLEKLNKRYLDEYQEELFGLGVSTLRSSWRDLGKELFEPLREFLQDLNLLYLIPADELSHLAMHALWIDSKKNSLIDVCPVVYISSVRLLRKLLYRRAKPLGTDMGNAAILGCPSPQISSDKNIREQILIEGNALTAANSLGIANPNLNPTGFSLMDAQFAPVLHLACHGSEDLHKPGIWLKSGLYTIPEILSLEIHSDLVFLSVCLSRQPGSANLLGNFVDVTEAFLCAGACSTISAYWKISAECGQLFVSHFYNYWLDNEHRKKMGKAEAMQKATLALRDRYGDQNLHQWAGFMLSGHYL